MSRSLESLEGFLGKEKFQRLGKHSAELLLRIAIKRIPKSPVGKTDISQIFDYWESFGHKLLTAIKYDEFPQDNEKELSSLIREVSARVFRKIVYQADAMWLPYLGKITPLQLSMVLEVNPEYEDFKEQTLLSIPVKSENGIDIVKAIAGDKLLAREADSGLVRIAKQLLWKCEVEIFVDGGYLFIKRLCNSESMDVNEDMDYTTVANEASAEGIPKFQIPNEYVFWSEATLKELVTSTYKEIPVSRWYFDNVANPESPLFISALEIARNPDYDAVVIL